MSNYVNDFLKTVKVFACMSELEINAVSAFLEKRRYAPRTRVFSQGEKGNELYFVYSGTVKSLVKQQDGKEREIFEFRKGDFFGEMAVIDDSPRSATCATPDGCELLVLSGLDFHRIVWDYPMLGAKLLKAMSVVMKQWLSSNSGFLADMVRWGETARKRAITDDLTGLFNRRFLDESIRSRFEGGVSAAKPCALITMDIDRFRDINSAYGPGAGDAVISQVGATLSVIVAEEGGDIIAARLSGDEFSVFLPHGGAREAAALAEKARLATAELFVFFRRGQGNAREGENERVAVSISLGYAAAPLDAPSGTASRSVSACHALVEAADAWLYAAKENGRNRVCGPLSGS